MQKALVMQTAPKIRANWSRPEGQRAKHIRREQNTTNIYWFLCASSLNCTKKKKPNEGLLVLIYKVCGS